MADVQETDPEELVYIQHTDVKSVGGPVPRHALPTWGASGWSEVQGVTVAQADGEVQVLDLAKMDRPELEDVARQRGLDPSTAKNKTELITLIEGNQPTT